MVILRTKWLLSHIDELRMSLLFPLHIYIFKGVYSSDYLQACMLVKQKHVEAEQLLKPSNPSSSSTRLAKRQGCVMPLFRVLPCQMIP
jgi:hypothetical protein